EVASRVREEARAANDDGRRGHVGYWLVDDGRSALESALGYRPSLRVMAGRWVLRHAGRCSGAALATTGLAALAVPALYMSTLEGTSLFVAGLALSVLPASILSVTLVHWIITLSVPPRVLPKLDFERGITSDCRAVVVMPVIIASAREVQGLVERLEMHWLTNPDPLLQFALLSDVADAPAQRMPGDEAVERALVDGIRILNERHAVDGEGRFHLLHRERQYNPSEGCWMGWERKRGKLEQFNRFVLGDDARAFPLREGDSAALAGIRFVVTVDADTMLPLGSVQRLVGAMAHPLNRPDVDSRTQRSRAGYTVIQPRVEISPESGTHSLFSRLYAGDTSIDIYSRAVSNVYQDLFGSGVFVGKGIYDVEAFHRTLEGRVPENALLSHDLFEGAHGRVALASDIVLYDGFPSGYLEYVHRLHRWIRGDWQLVPWLARRVPGTGDQVYQNPLSNLDRWRVLDNLRR
ncbi:MAG: cellobiose phosphorylase, partial [Gammaproteobacteria bacterium]